MNTRRRAFTLAELLTVLAIVAVLAGVLFPAFLSAKSAVKRTHCSSNMQQAQKATALYMSDYDDYFMPVNHRPAEPPNARLDRTWVQLILPYVGRSFSIFTCPADESVHQAQEASFDQDLVPGDMYGQYYSASMHVNMGYNYLYLAPIVFRSVNGRGQYVSEPRLGTDISDPSRTLLFVDSIWDRTPDGTPVGGGNWLVVPPCRFEGTPRDMTDTFHLDGIPYTPFFGWKISQENSPRRYGNAWPWHMGRINLVHVDGSVTSVSPSKLASGCDLRDSWRGLINDPGQYMWDTH